MRRPVRSSARLPGWRSVLDAHGVEHALLVGPNSGYGEDNRCLLDALDEGAGRYRGMAVVDNTISRAELADLQAAGVVGVTFNAALLGVDYYADAGPLLANLAALDMIADVQVDRRSARRTWRRCSSGRGAGGRRPLWPTRSGRGVDAPGFRELLRWGRSRAGGGETVRLLKVSRSPTHTSTSCPFIRRSGRRVRAGSVRLGVGLAVPADARARRLCTVTQPPRRAGARRRRPSARPLGHPRREFGYASASSAAAASAAPP